jgi:hypothetical protein
MPTSDTGQPKLSPRPRFDANIRGKNGRNRATNQMRKASPSSSYSNGSNRHGSNRQDPSAPSNSNLSSRPIPTGLVPGGIRQQLIAQAKVKAYPAGPTISESPIGSVSSASSELKLEVIRSGVVNDHLILNSKRRNLKR